MRRNGCSLMSLLSFLLLSSCLEAASVASRKRSVRPVDQHARQRRDLDDGELMYLYWNEPADLGVYLSAEMNRQGRYYARSEIPEAASLASTKEDSPVDLLDGKNTKRKSTTTCEGEKQWLQCEPYNLIKIHSAFWGRDDLGVCSNTHEARGLKTDKKCAQDEANTMIKVQNQCGDERECELVASDVFFDRSDCSDIYKYLRVEYECLHSESKIKETLDREHTNI